MNCIVALLLVCFASHGYASVSKPTCGGTTSSKDIQLLTPSNPPRECSYHIAAYSSNVCQLRIDFAMTLAQPSLPAADNELTYAQCVDDYFQVGGIKLCGIETQQHIYVPFNRSAGVTNVDLQIVLKARVGYTGLPTPSWDMKLTQLECPVGAAIRELDSLVYDVEATPEEEEDNEHFRPEARATIKDGFFVAPPGCLQYFPQGTGALTSFNYNNGEGIYPGHLNYAICFRRTTDTEELELKSMHFNLGAEFTHLKVLQLDNYCYSQLRSEDVNEDYLMIPQATVEESGVRATYFCGDSIQDVTIRSTNPGPLMMLFNSDGVYKQNEAGFAFSYRVL